MKILFASQAIAGHFNPMTGIGVRLKGEGHDVGWYTGRTLAGKLDGLGIPLHPFDRAIEHTGDNLNELYPQRARLKGPMAIRFDGERIFASNVTNFFEDIRDVYRRFPFDAVVMDNSMFIQRLVAVVLGKPVISFVAIGNMESDPLVPPMFFGFAPARTPVHKVLHAGARLVSDQFVTKPARDSYVRQLLGYGLQTRRGTPITDETYRWSHAIIQTGTASLDFPRRNVNPKVHYVGALLPHRAAAAVAPDAATAPAADAQQPTAVGTYRRTVVVTQGTVDNRDPAKLMVPTIEALKDSDSLIVVATGGSRTEELRRRYPQPNVLIEDYIDFASIFPFTDVFVTNGGFGGVLLSLSHGVPLVTAGLNEGKSDVNARVEYAGVGVNLKTETPSAAAIRSAVETVLGDPSWRARAQAMRGQFEAEDSVGAAVEVIKATVAASGTPDD
jgi:UDP:flavonoid glycosyltransferase YjiC (YdhE family)